MKKDNDYDLFAQSPFVLDLIVIRMLKTLDNPIEKFLFCYVFLLGNHQKDAAEILGIHETNVSRRLKNIRIKLSVYKKGYDM